MLRGGGLIAARHRGAAWADVAALCGFNDQAHMIRDFKALAGITPDAHVREAFTGPELDAQLDAAIHEFVTDPSHLAVDRGARNVRMSKIFDWYGKDFERGHKGYTSVKGTAARYADLLADAPADREAVRNQRAEVAFLDYDWALNDIGR